MAKKRKSSKRAKDRRSVVAPADDHVIRIKVVRDKQGRFAPKTLPKRQRLAPRGRAKTTVTIALVRDKQGHFAQKTLPKRKRWVPPVEKPPAEVPRKPVKKPPKKPVKKRPKLRFPTYKDIAAEAERMMQEKLGQMGEIFLSINGELSMSVKSFINKGGKTVDAELRIGNLPEEWRVIEGLPLIIAALSKVVRGAGPFPQKPAIGGAFWVSFALRFGPSNMTEMLEWANHYKHFRGLLQIGAYHTTAQNLSAMLHNALVTRVFVKGMWEKHGMPPVQLLVRFVWTIEKKDPGETRSAGERGRKKR